jgi:hypothetical protein
MELTHPASEFRIDPRLSRTGKLDLSVEQVPKLSAGGIETDDLGFPAAPTQAAAIGKLAATTRIEWRLRKQHPARQGIGDFGFD